MITDPGSISFTAASVARIGARCPGTSAVVITTSTLPVASAISSCWRCCCSGVSSFAYPPAPSRSPPSPAQELRAQRLDLLRDRRTPVEPLDDRAEALRHRDRLQPGHPGSPGLLVMPVRDQRARARPLLNSGLNPSLATGELAHNLAHERDPTLGVWRFHVGSDLQREVCVFGRAGGGAARRSPP
jgi:hypothetical protein